MVRIVILNIIFSLFVLVTVAQKPFVSLEVQPQTLEKGEPISITIKTNADGGIDMKFPDEFVQSGGVQSGISSSVEIINGKRHAVSYRFRTFTGYITKAGDFNIGPASVQYEKKAIQSEVYKVKVLDSKEMVSSSPEKNMDKLAFALIEHSKKEVYEGEPIIVLSKVYAQVPILQFEDYLPYEFDKATEEHGVGATDRVKTSYEVINGKNVQTYVFGKRVIFPEQTGDYTIQPFETVVIYDDPRSFFPNRKKLVSNAVNIKVKPLPDGTPSHFINGVGKYAMKGKMSSNYIQQGDVLEVKLKITGNGNIQNITAPKIDLPEGLEFYGDPEIADSITYCTLGGEGKRIFTYYIQVNKGGEIKIPTIQAAYFDTQKEVYQTMTLDLKPIYATPNEDFITLKEQAGSDSFMEPSLIGMQNSLTEKKREIGNAFTVSWGGGMLLLSPVLIGLLAGAVVRRKEEREVEKENASLSKNYLEDRIARIKELYAITSIEEKLNQLSYLFFGFLNDYLQIGKEQLTKSCILNQQEFSSAQKTLIINIWEKLEQSRYGMIYNEEEVNQLQAEIISLLDALKK